MNHPMGDIASSLDAKTHRHVMASKPVPHAMPSQPFGRERALWMCRRAGCGVWNAPKNDACRTCRGARAE